MIIVHKIYFSLLFNNCINILFYMLIKKLFFASQTVQYYINEHSFIKQPFYNVLYYVTYLVGIACIYFFITKM